MSAIGEAEAESHQPVENKFADEQAVFWKWIKEAEKDTCNKRVKPVYKRREKSTVTQEVEAKAETSECKGSEEFDNCIEQEGRPRC